MRDLLYIEAVEELLAYHADCRHDRTASDRERRSCCFPASSIDW